MHMAVLDIRHMCLGVIQLYEFYSIKSRTIANAGLLHDAGSETTSVC
jgi:hypothetical protein